MMNDHIPKNNFWQLFQSFEHSFKIFKANIGIFCIYKKIKIFHRHIFCSYKKLFELFISNNHPKNSKLLKCIQIYITFANIGNKNAKANKNKLEKQYFKVNSSPKDFLEGQERQFEKDQR